MRVLKASVSIAVGMALAALPILAHHAFSAEYDESRRIELKGTVTKVEWTNPHAYLYLKVQESPRKVAEWEFELGSPNGLARRGWSRFSVKQGDVISVTGYLSRDSAHLANARIVSMADGTTLFAGSPTDGGPSR